MSYESIYLDTGCFEKIPEISNIMKTVATSKPGNEFTNRFSWKNEIQEQILNLEPHLYIPLDIPKIVPRVSGGVGSVGVIMEKQFRFKMHFRQIKVFF